MWRFKGFVFLVLAFFSFGLYWLRFHVVQAPVLLETDYADVLPEAVLTVHVSGEIASPGLYSLPLGARVYELIDLAGGATELANLDKVNLARFLVDGAQIKVPAVKPVPKKLNATKPININTASKTELMSVPGIGPRIATDIIAYRDKNGFFIEPQALLHVKRIGPKTLKKMSPFIRF